MKCRFCRQVLKHVFIDLGFAPPSNAYLSRDDLQKPELYFPLRLFVCHHCWLVQTEDFIHKEDLFCADYAYFSSTSTSWLQHVDKFSSMICHRLKLGTESFVIEIASNDGCLLTNFTKRKIPCLGIEPTASTAASARRMGIPVLEEFFDSEIAHRLRSLRNQADLIIGNNIYAHVQDINDFTIGLKTLLKPGGTITLEFPHILRLLEHCQFDTIYHEHYSYFSLYTVTQIFAAAGLIVYDVEELTTHGGSLRIYGCHVEDLRHVENNVINVLTEEEKRGLQTLIAYQNFQQRAELMKDNLLIHLIGLKRNGKKLAAYGAAAKGNTLLNFAGVKQDLIPYVCDAAASKQDKFLPGSHIPIVSPAIMKEECPDVVLILPWNLSAEIIKHHSYVHNWGGVFIVAVPHIRTLVNVP